MFSTWQPKLVQYGWGVAFLEHPKVNEAIIYYMALSMQGVQGLRGFASRHYKSSPTFKKGLILSAIILVIRVMVNCSYILKWLHACRSTKIANSFLSYTLCCH
jgi:hypothetical protein